MDRSPSLRREIVWTNCGAGALCGTKDSSSSLACWKQRNRQMLPYGAFPCQRSRKMAMGSRCFLSQVHSAASRNIAIMSRVSTSECQTCFRSTDSVSLSYSRTAGECNIYAVDTITDSISQSQYHSHPPLGFRRQILSRSGLSYHRHECTTTCRRRLLFCHQAPPRGVCRLRR